MRPRFAAAFTFLALIAATCPATGHAADDAVARLTNALAAAEAEEGRTSPYLLPVIEQLAQAELRAGAFNQAAAARRRALDIAVHAFGCDSASAAQAMAALALVDIDRGRYLDGEPLLIIAERVLASRVIPDQPVMPALLAGRARIALARGETKAAEDWAERAAELMRKNPDRRSAEPLRALGAVFAGEERFDEAERVLAEALAQDRKYHRAGGADTARSLAEFARLRLRQGQPAAALPLIEEALAIDQQRLGAAHPFIADDFHDLGLVYNALHRPGEARKAFAAALGLLERGAGRETPRVGYTELELARLYREAGDTAAADAAYRDARRVLHKAEAEEHRRQREV